MTVEEIRQSIGADSLGYISLDGLVAATSVPKRQLCRACFDGVYPIRLPEDRALDMGLVQPSAPPGAAPSAPPDPALLHTVPLAGGS